jgi:Zn-dependent protease with chaperone function
MRKLIVLGALALAAAAAVAVIAQTPPPQPPPTPEKKGERRLEVHVTPEMIRHSRINDTLYFAEVLWGAGALLLVLGTRWSARLRDLASRATSKRFIVAMLYFVLLSLVLTVLQFPLDFYGGYVVPHQFDLTDQSFGGWLGDFAKALGVNLVIGAPIAALALLGIRKIQRWWLVLWLGSIPLIILAVVATPLIIDPLFNKFEPLRDETLKRALLDEASQAGIEGSRVYQVNKSKQTKTMNAYVTGLGPSKRIVMWDTLLQKLDHEEILAVMGHEMGHYVLNHLWKGLAFGVALSFLGFFFAQKMYEKGLARWGGRWGIGEKGDPAALPWLLLVASVLSFVVTPVAAGFSRHVEHQSDIFGLELTHGNEAMASAFVKFAEDSKADPRPPRIIEWWRYSHPSLGRRIDFVLQYRPWEQGKPNELWKPRK